MSDRSTFDAFEQRIADELGRYVAPVTDPKPVAEIVKVAMRPRGLGARARNASRRRRFLVLGLAAAFLVPAAYFGAASVSPPAPDVVRPSRTPGPVPTALPSTSVASGYVSIFIRRDEGSEPGTTIFAVRPDGTEALLRKVPDSILAGRGKVSGWGIVAESGWLALGVDLQGGPWPMMLVDLRDTQAQPWTVDQANIGGIGPRWGPTGLIAASMGSTDRGLVIADPTTHTTHLMAMQTHGLVGGGPTIVWSGDGTGIVGSKGDQSTFDVVPIDGSAPRSGIGQVFDPQGTYGPGMTELRICSSDVGCSGGDDGRVDRVAPDGSTQTIWRQQGAGRALAASFSGSANAYWLTVDHGGGRQVALVHVHDGRADTVSAIDRAADWGYVSAPVEAPDQAMTALRVDRGGSTSSAEEAAVLVPLNGTPPSFHTGHFAGFVDGTASAVFASGPYEAPADTMPPAGDPYRLPSLDELIAAELQLNPGRRVLAKATHEAVDGELMLNTYDVHRDQAGAGDVYLDCYGPSSVTVTSDTESVTSPCVRAGASVLTVDATSPITVKAWGETSWRVVLYSP